MMPIGPLMIEHRLIERMIAVIKDELGRINTRNRAEVIFIDTVVDFLRTYADRTHHGKEEDILFRDLRKVALSPDLKRIMDELADEHVYARKTVRALAAAKDSYVHGDAGAVKDIIANLNILVGFYPEHIKKEDKRFFLPCMAYFSAEQQAAMLQEFWEFDRKLIHEKYKVVVEQLSAA